VGQTTPTSVLSSAVSSFSQQLYDKIAANKTEVVYSPFSIHSALSMTSQGARGRTSGEMLFTLGVDGMQGGPHQAYRDVISQLNSAKSVSLYTGNGVFLNPRWRVTPGFVQQCADNYLAKADELDMMAAQGPEAKVNDFVQNNTHGMIKDLLPKYSLTADTAMVLVNTIYFNGTWANQFKKFSTRQQKFTQLGGSSSQVDMMRDTRSVKVKVDSSLKADIAQIPFKGNRFSLYIVLPHDNDGITQLESTMSGSSDVDNLFEGLQHQYTNLQIPKFKLESSFELKETLKKLGMFAAFNPNLADFSGLSQEPLAYMSSVRHKAVMEVQESGVTAAASTSIVIAIKNMVIGGPTPRDFIADHPFVFYLRDDVTKTVLFQGKYSG